MPEVHQSKAGAH